MARGSLRSKILRRLFKPIPKFFDSRCLYKTAALPSYCVGLRGTAIWSFDDYQETFVQSVLDNRILHIGQVDPSAPTSNSSPTTKEVRHQKIRQFYPLYQRSVLLNSAGKPLDITYFTHAGQADPSTPCSK
jgi:hypothetical protein